MMNNHRSNDSRINIRRVTVFAYFQLLLGVLLLAYNLEAWLTDASLSWTWVVLNVIVVASVFAVYLNPDIVGAGDEAALNYLLVAALVASIATLLGIPSFFL